MPNFDGGPMRLDRANSQVPFRIATYQDKPARRTAGNSFNCALPKLPSDKVLKEALSNKPLILTDVNLMPPEVRLLELAAIDEVVIALDRGVDLARALMLNQHQGYETRGPNTPDDIAYLRELYAEAGIPHLFSDAEISQNTTELSFGIIGSSGSGKSFTFKSILELFPRAIYHKELRRWQIPFIVIEMVFDGVSRHTLATEIFDAFDRAIPGANYHETYVAKCGMNAETRLAIALRFARTLGVGCIIVDESQRQPGATDSEGKIKPNSRTKPGDETPLFKLLVTASNKAHIPLCMSGSLAGLNLLGGSFSKVRRMMGRGSAIWGPLHPTFRLDDPRYMGEFEHYMVGIVAYQFTKTRLTLDVDLLKHFWKLTKGIPDTISKLFHSAQRMAIVLGGKEEVTYQLLEDAYRAEMLAGHIHLQALETADPELEALARDLCHPSVTPLHQARVARAMKAAGMEPHSAHTPIDIGPSKLTNGAKGTPTAGSVGIYGGMTTGGAQAKADLLAGRNPSGSPKRA